MEQHLQEILKQIEGLHPGLIWLFLFLSNFFENLFPPWPGDTVNAFAGFLLARKDSIGFLNVLSSTILGNLFGALIMYYFGKQVISLIKNYNIPFKDKFYSEKGLEQTINWFQKYSLIVVLFSRFSAGIRFFVSIVAGLSRMPIWSFITVFSLGVILWCGLIIGSAYYLGKNWEYIREVLSIYNKIIISFFLFLFALYGFYRYKKKKREV